MNKFFNFIEKNRNYLFLFLLIVVYLLLDYQTILFLRPQGLHFIRQTDSLSFVANYYNHGLDFFHPQVFNLQSLDGKSAAEFPILYFITALLYFVFGEHEWILRLITLSICSAGFIYLFKLLLLLLKDTVYAIIFSFIFISSTILLYYSNNFLPDANALGFTLVGWYFFFTFLRNNEAKISLIKSFIFFTSASLLKITFFINPITAILTLMAFSFSKEVRIIDLFKKAKFPFLLFTASLLIITSWYLYIDYYNRINNNSCFLMKPLPIWLMNKQSIIEVWGYISEYWYSKYYFQTTIHLFAILMIVGFLFIKKSEKKTLIPSSILTIGTICYILLFYAQFKDHDYYFINVIPGIILLITNSFITLKNRFPKLTNNLILKLSLMTICILSLNYAREKLNQRYNNKNDMYASIGIKLSETRQYLDSLGIPQNAKFIIMTDKSLNGGLYFINHPGWNIPDTSESSLSKMKSCINSADYILYTDKISPKFDYGTYVGENNGIVLHNAKSINEQTAH